MSDRLKLDRQSQTARSCKSGASGLLVRVLALMTGGLMVLLSAPPISHAQQTSTIIAAETIVVTATKPTLLGLKIASADKLPANTYLRVAKLPPDASLTDGYRVSASTWAVPLDRLNRVSVRINGQFRGPHAIELLLTSLDGKTLDKKMVTLTALAEPTTPPKLTTEAQKQDSKTRQDGTELMQATAKLAVGSKQPPALQHASPSLAKAMTPEQKRRAIRFVERGKTFLNDGNVNTARLFFRRATDMGWADAAMALAATYDPDELANLGIVGAPANVAEARRWYERAKQLGAPGAAASLETLPPQ